MLTWNVATKSSCLGPGSQASKSSMPPEAKALQEDRVCISFTSDSPYKSLWGGGEEERGESFCVLGYHSCCCRCKETLATQGPPDVDGGTEHSARAKQRGRTRRCSTNAVSERTGDTPNSADTPPRHRVKSTFLQKGNYTPDSSWLGKEGNTAHRVRKCLLS